MQYVLWILTWWVVGTNVLNRTADRGWLFTWALLLLTLVPLRVLVTWLQGSIAIGAGARLKQRLFFGALRMEPDSIRHQGAGQLLGRVLECEAVESLALSGGFLAFVALIELVISIFVLASGAGGLLQAGLLAGWLFVSGINARRYYRRNREWTDVRLAMTHDLVESMVGHRTRLAQLPPDRWHEGEDEALESYLKSSKAMDESTVALLAVAPRGWLVLATARFGAGVRRVEMHSTASIAIAVGGMLLAYRALRRCATGAWQLAGAAVAWQRASVLYHAATRTELIGSLDAAADAISEGALEARDLVFRYSPKTPPVLRGCSLRISAGDRLVLEGESGGGKSTLVSLLVGLRDPDSGLASDRRLGSRDARRRGLAEAHRRRAAVPREPCAGRNVRLQPADGQAHDALGRTICRKPKRFAASSVSAILSSACRPEYCRWWARPAGNCRTASAAACTSRARCCRTPDWWCSTKASLRSIRKIFSARWNAS